MADHSVLVKIVPAYVVHAYDLLTVDVGEICGLENRFKWSSAEVYGKFQTES